MSWSDLLNKLRGVPSDEFLAQGGHFLLAVSAAALPGWVGGTTAAKWGTAAILTYATIKEVLWDPKMEENNAFWPEGAKDMLFFILGTAAAWVAHWVV